MFQAIHHTDADVAIELCEAISRHFNVPSLYLTAAIDWCSSSPEHHVYAVFFDRLACRREYEHRLAQPPGEETITLLAEAPSPHVLSLFIQAFEHGRRMLGKVPSTDMISMFFAGYLAAGGMI